MNRRSFLKRFITALGLAVAWPLMPSIGRVEAVNMITSPASTIWFPAALHDWGPVAGWMIVRGDGQALTSGGFYVGKIHVHAGDTIGVDLVEIDAVITDLQVDPHDVHVALFMEDEWGRALEVKGEGYRRVLIDWRWAIGGTP